MTANAQRSGSPPAVRRFLSEAGTLLRAGIACVTATGVDFAVLVALVEAAHQSVPLATAAAATAGALANYVLQRRVVFRARAERKRTQLPKYALVAGTTLAVSTGLTTLIAGLGVHYVIARALGSGLTFLLVHYPLSRWAVFRQPISVESAHTPGGGDVMSESSRPVDLSVVVPAWNEAERLPAALVAMSQVLAERPWSHEIIVVDDGSTDGTADRVRAMAPRVPGLAVIGYEQNRGKGHAVATGVRAAQGRFVLFADADNSVPMTEVDKLVAALEAGADAAIGSRYAAGAHVAVRQPWYRVGWSRLANAVVRLALCPGIHDTQCGFKAFRREAAAEAFSRLTIDRWGFDLELLTLLARAGRKVVEVPVSWTDDPRSRVSPVKDAVRITTDFLRVWTNLLRGRYPAPPRRAGARAS